MSAQVRPTLLDILARGQGLDWCSYVSMTIPRNKVCSWSHHRGELSTMTDVISVFTITEEPKKKKITATHQTESSLLSELTSSVTKPEK